MKREHKEILKSYAGRDHEIINQYLRKGVLGSKEMNDKITLLDEALEECLSVSIEYVYRMDIVLEPYLIEWYKLNKGKVITRNDFLSTFGKEKKIHEYNLRIKTACNSKGKEISEHLYNGQVESEVLFQIGAKFVIREVSETLIELEECNDCSSDIIFTQENVIADPRIQTFMDEFND